jgi:hypothetical protein
MTVLTLTTAGLASGGHLTRGALVFTAGLAVLDAGVFVAISGLAATAIVEGRVSLFRGAAGCASVLMRCAGISSSAPMVGSAGRSPASWTPMACRCRGGQQA